jgi:hypothetical protein
MNGKDAVLFIRWVLSLPFTILNNCLRLRQHIAFLRLAAATQIFCQCGSPLSLVGLWRVLLFVHLPGTSPPYVSPLRQDTENMSVLRLWSDNETPGALL